MRSMRTPEGGSSYRVRGHQEGAELFSLFTFYVNTPKGAVVTKQVPINTNLSLILLNPQCSGGAVGGGAANRPFQKFGGASP